MVISAPIQVPYAAVREVKREVGASPTLPPQR